MVKKGQVKRYVSHPFPKAKISSSLLGCWFATPSVLQQIPLKTIEDKILLPVWHGCVYDSNIQDKSYDDLSKLFPQKLP